LQQREKAAGLKAGGMVKKKCVEGGKIEGPGGPREDLIPIMASNGEFMIKASSAKILGPELLEALNEVGDEPKNPKDDAKEGKKMAIGGEVEAPVEVEFSEEAKSNGRSMLNSFNPMAVPQLEMKTGGMVRKMAIPHMADGDSVDKAKRRTDMLAQIPGSGTAPAPDGINTGNDFTRNVNNSLNALGGMGVVASVPLKAAQVGQGAIRGAMNAPPVLQNMIPRLMAPAAQAAPDFVAGASGVAKAGGANLPAVIGNTQIPIAKATNVALQEGAKANQMAAATRSLGNASAGAGMLDGQQAPLAQPATPAPAPATTQSPVEKAYADPSRKLDVNYGAGSAPAPAPAPATPNPELNDPTSNASILARNPGGAIRKVVQPNGTVSYSGGNVTGAEAGFVGADGKPISGGPGGGFMVVQGRSKDEIDRTLTNPDGSRWSAADNQIMAANIRDGVHKYLGTSRDPRNAPQRTKAGHAAAVQREQIAMQNKRYGEQNAIAQEQLGMSKTEHKAKMDKEKQIADVQAEYMAAQGDPAKEAIVKRKMLALGLLKEQDANKFTVVPEYDGNGTRIGTTVLDNQGKALDLKGGQQGAQTYDAWKAKLLAHPSNKGQPVPSEQQLQAEYAKQFPKG